VPHEGLGQTLTREPDAPGTLIMEDAPVHTVRRTLLSRVFTPRGMAALEPKIREFCARGLDPLVGAGRFVFLDEAGTVRRLTRNEVFPYVSVISGAGNETTNCLIGWIGKVLADQPDQRRELVADRSLIPNTIEEILCYDPSALQVARYVARDVETL
jgi:cytochrome P450